MMNNRFCDNTNHILNDYLINHTDSNYTDGEERTKLYSRLKKRNELFLLLERNGELYLQDKWVYKLMEAFIEAHEGSWGTNLDSNKIEVYNSLKSIGELYLLFEGHYSWDKAGLL